MKNNWKNLQDLLFFQEGPGVRKNQFRNNGIKLLNVGNINNKKLNLDTTSIFITEEEAYGKYSHFLVEDGDLLICCSGIVVDNFHNKIVFAEEKHLPLCLNTSTMRFRTLNNDILNIKYFYYFLMTRLFKEQLQKLITGSAQLNFGPSHIKKISMPIIEMNKQKQIAKTLDKANELIELRKESITKLDALAKSIFIDMFGDPVSNPKGWEIKKFNDIFIKITDGTHNSPPMCKTGYKYITAKHIKENGINFEKHETYISKEEHEKIFSRCNPKKGDILYIKDGATTGIACINTFDEEFSLLSSVALLKPSHQIKSEYVVSYLNNPSIKNNILLNMAGGAIQRLTIKKIKDINIIIPPLDLQNKFAKIIEKIEEQKSLYEKELEKLEENFQALLQKSFQE